MRDVAQVEPDAHEITELLVAWREGDADALDLLIERVYGRLRAIAHGHLRWERQGHTLETANLVHEAYLRLVDQQRVSWRDRSHFFAISSQLMRRILVDHARRKATEKRGGQGVRLSLGDLADEGAHLAGAHLASEPDPDLLALDEALDALAAHDADAARLVELRCFGGLTKEEISEVMGFSTATFSRRWRLVRAWLHAYLVKGERLEL